MDVLLDDVTSRLFFQLPFIKKDVDDLITVIPIDKKDEMFTIFNNYHPSLQFTMEGEVNGKLPSLDMLLTHDSVSESINTAWYKKPTSSGRMLNFLSTHNYNQKIGTASGFIHRVLNLSFNINNDTLAVIEQQLQSNNYPNALIKRLLHIHLRKLQTLDVTLTNNTIDTGQVPPAEKIYRSLIFVDNISYKIGKIIKTHFPNIMLRYQCNCTINSVFRSKWIDCNIPALFSLDHVVCVTSLT